ncbi:hypothetical protein U9M48_022605 [Paspalum notatum var. saurae]|uniref:NAC domain-containing protein n=1 Tax=Paspalum notatum var. saurae TaxID=547442 RepID=A0AAQ3WUZ8_PASNO
MDTFSHVPPGFRFHPTDEELLDYYLRKKVASNKIDLDVIKDIDLYKIEPWDLQEKCKIGMEEQNEWYFFSHKDKKYPTGTRTNRATTAGFWKATGRDKPIYTKNCLVGMRKTLVFYRGRAPNGQKSDWIMHEYRLETTENGIAPVRGRMGGLQGVQEASGHRAEIGRRRAVLVRRRPRRRVHAGPRLADAHHHHHPNAAAAYGGGQQLYHCKPELEYHHLLPSQEAFLQQLPQLESPKPPAYIAAQGSCSLQSPDEASGYTAPQPPMEAAYMAAGDDDSVTDWRVLDKFVASQLFSHIDGTAKEAGYSSNPAGAFQAAENKQPQEEALDYASTSASGGGEADMWK